MRTIEVIFTDADLRRVKLVIQQDDVTWQTLLDQAVGDMQKIADTLEQG